MWIFSSSIVLILLMDVCEVNGHPLKFENEREKFQHILEKVGNSDFYEEEEEAVNRNPVDLQSAPLKKTESKRWPDGFVPYVLAPEFSSDEQRMIRDALYDIERAAPCIRFHRYALNDRNVPNTHVYVQREGGCFSLIGRTSSGRKQILALSSYCLQKKTIIHEFLHALGFYHEQSRPDRDQYIQINWDKINPSSTVNFRKTTRSNDLGVPYDRVSIMHYSNFAFQKPGYNGKTMVWKANPNLPLGGDRLSSYDILQLNRLYCDGFTTRMPPPTRKTTKIKPTIRGCNDLNGWCKYARPSHCTMSHIQRLCPKACGNCRGVDNNRWGMLQSKSM